MLLEDVSTLYGPGIELTSTRNRRERTKATIITATTSTSPTL